ncbi:MAG TPA: invasion associated locus B family protein [Hyphomicrobium sp.]|jgi:invasion protein IalB
MNKTRIFAAVLAVSGALLATKAGAQTAPPTGAQTAPPTGAQTGAPTVELVETQGGWGLYADTATPKQVCFVAAPPQAVEPLGANRGPIYFYVSAWPKDGVKAEPSVKVGYPIAADKGITVTIGADTFKLFAKGERGFVSEPAEEQKLIEAMKSGETALVKATSARGTATTDTYALSGLGAALTKMGEVCQ